MLETVQAWPPNLSRFDNSNATARLTGAIRTKTQPSLDNSESIKDNSARQL